MRRAGAIIIGKTNVPEFGAGSQTFNKVFGATRNPYDLTKTCGGSSGGSAVSLACGLAPVVSGTDTGGSLRNPAAFCNVVGFRPSVGRVPNPKAAFAWSTLSTSGCLGRSVADLAYVLSTIAGPDSRAPLSINEPGEIFARPLDRSFKGVRVAWFKDLGGVPFDPRVRAVVDGHRKTFESLGCIVEQAEPDFASAEIAFRVLRALGSANAYGARLHDHPDAFKDTLKGEIEEGQRLTGMDVARADAAHGQLWRGFQAFLEKYEYFVLPTTQLPAVRRRHALPHGNRGREVRQLHRLDEILLVHLGHGQSSRVGPGRFYPGRASRRRANRRPQQRRFFRIANGARVRTGDRLRQEAPGHRVAQPLLAVQFCRPRVTSSLRVRSQKSHRQECLCYATSNPALRRPSIRCSTSSGSHHFANSTPAAVAKSGLIASNSRTALRAASRSPSCP